MRNAAAEVEDEEETIEYPAWTPPLCGWVYRVDVDEEDGTVSIPDLPSFIHIDYNDDGSCEAVLTDLSVLDNASNVVADSLEELFDELNSLLSPLDELFLPYPKK